MTGYLVKRVISLPLTLLGVSVVTFLFLRLIPGDAITARLGTSTALSAEQMARMRAYFWLGTLIILLFARYLHWMPNTGGFVDLLVDPAANLRFLIFPALTLGVGMAAVVMRTTRSAMLDVLSSDYVRTARAKGLPAAQV